ncbi:unnamed protein product [Agarophyton chilense]|eukprot:gb/GEZJ01005182.1/.p1 GENE.gb/GEZJ01005182.1/~~gb/GEZJ01005182.1/.p1  ORF type:complete len:238 (-),score=21.13 gb/GEZJ01005182.1/:1465-2178(-)
MAPFLFVFDFDETLVPHNTDLLPLIHLAPDLLHSHVNNPHHRALGWTTLMNTVLSILHSRHLSPAKILQTMHQAVIHPATKSMLSTLFNNPHVHCAIASDANSLYIQSCLEVNHINPSQFTAGIFTNPAHVHLDTIFVKPFATQPHSCPTCPPNLCKSIVLKHLQTRYPSHTLVYVGDGSNDYCPAKRIPTDGYVLPRQAFRLEHKILQHGQVHCQVRSWASAEQLQSIVSHILQPK